jgi:ATP-dependent HslUV protease subunit HslV
MHRAFRGIHSASRCLQGGYGSISTGVYGASGLMHQFEPIHATTILSVRKDDQVAVVGDGQMTQGSFVAKPNARKVRRVGDGNVIAGFAGATADALALIERLEGKLDQYPTQLARACVELAKQWRTEKYLRQLQATILVVDKDMSLQVTGVGDVIEPPDGIIAIGSGGPFALAAARALIDTDMDAMAIAEKAMGIAADMCIYTNHNFVRDRLPGDELE